MGQAGTSPAIWRTRHDRHLTELQQTLLRDGCYLPGVKNEDPLDLALSADTRFPAIINGWNNELEPDSRAVPWKPEEPIELTLREPAMVACVHVSLADRRRKATFAVEAAVDGRWKELVRSPGTSKQRRHVYNVEPIKAGTLRFRLIESSGPVAIAEVRVYSQPGRETKVKLPEPVGFPPVRRH